MSTDADLDAYREEACGWLVANLERKRPEDPSGPFEVDHYTPELIAHSRRLQRQLYEGGYLGITWPEAYGGRGLTPLHQRIFDEESRPFVMPDFGG